MAPQPKKKWSSARQGKRRGTHKISMPSLVKCSNCGELKMTHTVCRSCGYFAGKEIIKQPEKTKVRNLQS
ncbi:MAG TPA: 50S ribosomal protein L32 [Patescibacteria group bacterium]